jgi:phenylalanine-4-hydroxylase
VIDVAPQPWPRSPIPDEFSALPEVPDGVFTAPLQRPRTSARLARAAQRDYSSDDDAIWKRCSSGRWKSFPAALAEAVLRRAAEAPPRRGGVPEFARPVGAARRADRVERGPRCRC